MHYWVTVENTTFRFCEGEPITNLVIAKAAKGRRDQYFWRIPSQQSVG